jgi:hypothetical protein
MTRSLVLTRPIIPQVLFDSGPMSGATSIPGGTGLTGEQRDDVGEEGRQSPRVGHLDAEVGELQLVAHRVLPVSVRR